MENSNSMELEEKNIVDKELQAIKRRYAEMEQEALLLRKQMEQDSNTGETDDLVDQDGESIQSIQESIAASKVERTMNKFELDSRSIYVGNVDYGTEAEELGMFFQKCGEVNRVTILCDKFTKQPKGFAYVEFADKESVKKAMAIKSSEFRGRLLIIMPKRTNIYGITTTDRQPRGMAMRGRGMFPRRGRGSTRPFRGRYMGGNGRYIGSSRPGARPHNIFHSPF